MNLVEGSDVSDEEDGDQLTFVPPLRTITRHGRLAGTWRRNFAMSGDESADEESTPRKRQFIHTQRKCLARDNFQKDGTEENESHVYITRSGRKAGTWKRFDRD